VEGNTQETDDMARITPWRALFLIVGLTWLAYFVMGWFDNTTELVPDHGDALGWCFLLGGFGAVVAAVLVLTQWKRLVLAQRIVWPLCAALIGFLTLFLFSSTATELVENRNDFPAAQTKTFDGFLSISRAYHTHGKSQSWNIQTMPVWSNMEITQADYEFMLSHRPEGPNASNKDEITSRGLFCAHVTMQRTDKALRVLHAGRGKLPEGTVIICPKVGR
jgi:hypothetical protein